MAKDYLIRLSVYPYIRKYLLFHYSEPFFVTENGFAPAFIYNALEHMPKVNPADVRKKDKIIYGEFIGVLVGEGTLRKKGSLVSSDNVKRFNSVVADLLHEEMYRLITQLKKAGYQVDETIREFQAMYGFTEDELPFENLKRWYYRERMRLDERAKERREVHPQFTLNFFEEAKQHPEITTAILNQSPLNLLFAS
ncbi:hypothetical protein GCM10023149_30940 [Mucilaginibacter gynuensis]|uniref:Uncharacterized protein n=1 Tax=Mucilaginibacter gynuensis TaxID=1302236 RepID=A0ABP8GN94_9SPHI